MKALNMTKNVKIAMVTVVAVVILIVVIYYVGRYAGKVANSTGNKGKLPSETDWGSALSESESIMIQNHAKGLYKEMKGINVLPRDFSVFTSYLAATDRVFVGAANYFNDNYGNGENLAKWLKGENFEFTNIGLGKVADQIIERLNKHGIYA